jgi:hypothetical protein
MAIYFYLVICLCYLYMCSKYICIVSRGNAWAFILVFLKQTNFSFEFKHVMGNMSIFLYYHLLWRDGRDQVRWRMIIGLRTRIPCFFRQEGCRENDMINIIINTFETRFFFGFLSEVLNHRWFPPTTVQAMEIQTRHLNWEKWPTSIYSVWHSTILARTLCAHHCATCWKS